jgi:hypothetical protein
MLTIALVIIVVAIKEPHAQGRIAKQSCWLAETIQTEGKSKWPVLRNGVRNFTHLLQTFSLTLIETEDLLVSSAGTLIASQ